MTKWLLAVPALLLLTPATGLSASPAPASTAPAPSPAAVKPPESGACLECHEDPGLEREAGGKVRFDKTAWQASVHGQAEVECVQCHVNLAAASLPHAAKLGRATCTPCHDDQVQAYARGVHSRARLEGDGDAATCADCHGDHGILPAKDPASLTNHFRLVQTCGRCHGDPKLIARAKIRIGDTFHQFEDSIHGKALSRSGLVVAPNCAGCHGSHDIRNTADPDSPVRKQNVPKTCGKCHEGILQQYRQGIHAERLAAGDPRAPACSDCHTAHGIQSTEKAAWRLDVLHECGSCHDDQIRSYRDTYHGKVSELGFERIATCSDCHGAHAVFPESDPRSAVAPANRAATCRKCHPGANANFAAYDPHVQPDNRERNALIFYTQKLMNWLLVAVFSFFGIHTALWLTRELIERRRGQRPAGG